MQARHEVAHVLRQSWDDLVTLGHNTWQLSTLRAIRDCRTSALGGHIDACDACGNLSISYNSCRNRHCPKCQGEKRAAWIQAREAELLPVPYFHVVFTLPCALNQLAMHQPKAVYDSLFEAAWKTLNQFGRQAYGIQSGMIAILHTWGQNLSLHPHLHCIVPGGGINQNGQWRSTRVEGKFLYPVKAMSQVFKAKYLSSLRSRTKLDVQIGEHLYRQKWVVYAKRPFGKPEQVIEYLGRYTHKIAISNHRILSIDSETVTFSYKDYRDSEKKKSMTLSHCEFIRRFAMHIMPKRYIRIRHFGFLSSFWKRKKLKILQTQLIRHQVPPSNESKKPRICPCCKVGHLHIILQFDARGPPMLTENVISLILTTLKSS